MDWMIDALSAQQVRLREHSDVAAELRLLGDPYRIPSSLHLRFWR